MSTVKITVSSGGELKAEGFGFIGIGCADSVLPAVLCMCQTTPDIDFKDEYYQPELEEHERVLA